jgi:glycosyltransferase involved in cell wall biosynthesis
MPEVSVIIPTLNREGPLIETLVSLASTVGFDDYEIIVIDQSDQVSNRLVNFLATTPIKVNYYRVNYKSLPAARNHGAQLALGKILVYIDDDVELLPQFLKAHWEQYKRRGVVGVTGPIPSTSQRLRRRDELPKNYRYLVKQGRILRDVDFEHPTTWLPGCNMSFRRDSLFAVGGFDENFFGAAIGEDAELTSRIKAFAGELIYDPKAALIHKTVSNGGCRDFESQARYTTSFIANQVYFLMRIKAPMLQKWRVHWYGLRAMVLNKKNVFGFRWFQHFRIYVESVFIALGKWRVASTSEKRWLPWSEKRLKDALMSPERQGPHQSPRLTN